MKLVELKKFKEIVTNPCFVAWNRGIVTCNDKTYKIRYINVDGTNYPYIEVPEPKIECEYESKKDITIEFDENTNIKIRCINRPENKKYLKNCFYDFGNDTYFVTGIGYKSIKAVKNDNAVPEYFWYKDEEGSFLLNKLMNVIGQTSLI